MILLALLVPVVMVAFLFASDALMDLLSPPQATTGEDVPVTGERAVLVGSADDLV
ncbi:hypothetical protein [Streptomyces sp. NPDC050856]|uniref:hypothetical protein n=1 Tax=Streptomyces sp. NPDC050856 TaxID=3154939 RepID=UPI003409E1F8